MNFLSWELPNGDAIAKQSNDPDERYEETLRHPLEIVDMNSETFLETSIP
jgi:hypothetical protein